MIMLFYPKFFVDTGDMSETTAIEAGIALKRFLVEEKLLINEKEVLSRPDGLDDALYLEDLNEDGLEVMRKGLDRYLARFDRNRNADPADVSILRRAVAAFRKA